MSRRRRTFITESNDEKLNANMPGYNVYDFDDNLEAFIRAVKLRGRSSETLKFYRNELGKFRKILEEQDVSVRVDWLSREVINRNFIEYSTEVRRNKMSTVGLRLRAVRAFFNWMVGEGVLKESPVAGIVIRSHRSEVETYTREQLNDIFRQPDLETFVGYRDYAILTIFLETGIRLRELTDIKMDDVRMTDSQILINDKNGGFRLVPLQKQAKNVLNRYLKARGTSPSPYLFITQDDTQMSRKAVQDRVKKYGRMAGVTNVRNSPHTFRHTFAKMSVRNGANLFDLQKILGHSTLDMVRVYVNLFSNEVAEAHSKFSPIENLHMPE